MEDTDVIILWGSNARETHPIFFHHVLAGVRNGARLYCVDPRRTSSARWADVWLGLDVGTDIALSNTMAREIIHAGLHNETFIERATSGFEDYAASVEEWTLERGEAVTGVPAEVIAEMAHTWARADRAQLCWTLGITEHHNGVDNVLALINLALLCGHVGRYGCGLNPLRGQNNVQGGGDMGAIPNKLPGFQDILDDEARLKFDAAWGSHIPPRHGLHLTDMFEAMEHGEMTALYVIGENPAQSEAESEHAVELLGNLDHLVVQDIFLTRTAQLAVGRAAGQRGVVRVRGHGDQQRAPGAAGAQAALEPPEGARDDIGIIVEIARRLGHDWTYASSEAVWDELRSLSPMHAGMSYRRLEELGGIQWPCSVGGPPRAVAGCTAGCGPRTRPSGAVRRRSRSSSTSRRSTRSTTSSRCGSRPAAGSTRTTPGCSRAASPPRCASARRSTCRRRTPSASAIEPGEQVRVSSRRGTLIAPARIDPGLRPGLVFMTMHFPDEIDTNTLTIEAIDPKSGTAEFKASAVRVEKLQPLAAAGG